MIPANRKIRPVKQAAIICSILVTACMSDVARLEKAHQEDPDDVKVLEQLATAYLNEGRRDDAAETYDLIAQLDPKHEDALCCAGAIYYYTGRQKIAIDRFNRQIERNNHPFAHLNLAEVRMLAVDYSGAEAELSRAIELGVGPIGEYYLAILRWRQLRTDEMNAQLEIAHAAGDRAPAADAGVPDVMKFDDALSDIEYYARLHSDAVEIAQKEFTPETGHTDISPDEWIDFRLALVRATKIPAFLRVCRTEVLNDEWRVHLGGVYESEEGKLMEVMRTVHYRPSTRRILDIGKIYARVIVEGRPPCWCAWNEIDCTAPDDS
jgi:tetratricopeptide (TPR) repeat protein